MNFIYFIIIFSHAFSVRADSTIYNSLISFGGDRSLLNKLSIPNCSSAKNSASCNSCATLVQKFTRQTSKQVSEQSFFQDYQNTAQFAANALSASTGSAPLDLKNMNVVAALNIGGAGVVKKAEYDWPLMRQQLVYADQNLRSCQSAATRVLSACSSIAGTQLTQIANQIQKACASQLAALENYLAQEDTAMRTAAAAGQTDLDTAKLLGTPEMNAPSDSLHRQSLPVKSGPITPLTPEEMDKAGRNNACYGCAGG